MGVNMDVYMSDFAPATAITHLDNLRHNLSYFRSLLSENTRVMAMVKSNAYGSSAVEVGRELNRLGVRDLGVAYTYEGKELRTHGVSGSIMVMNPVPGDFPDLINHQLEPELSNMEILTKWVNYISREKIANYPVHLELDTGMRRLGFDNNDLGSLVEVLCATPSMQVKSVFSHLSSSPTSEKDAFTKSQFNLFEEWTALINRNLPKPVTRHILNSAGIVRFPEYQYDMVRLGIGLYGVGLESLSVHEDLRPVQSLYASISQIKKVSAGESIGYEQNGQLQSDGKIAVLNIGYADGVPRLAGNGRFSVRIGKVLCPVVGNVCMDMIMVDISNCPDVTAGTPVEIYGQNNPVHHLANAGNTIPYEILTGNRKRVHRLIAE